MPIPYVVPGVSVSQTVTPQIVPITVAPTSLCVIGPGQGYESHSEVFLLSDNAEVTLGTLGAVTSSIVVTDNSNAASAPFIASTTTLGNKDYNIDTSLFASTGQVKIGRAMQTNITNGQTVTVYYENASSPAQGSSFTEYLTLTNLTSDVPVHVSSTTQAASVRVMSEGLAPSGDYTITGAGTGTVTLARQSGALVLGKYQSVFVDYSIGSVFYPNYSIQLNNTTTVSLPATSTGHVVKTAPSLPAATNTAVLYAAAVAQTDNDYVLTGSGVTTAIARSSGSTTMGVANDGLVVQVNYNAIPPNYWLATKCFNQGQVEAQFGPAFSSTGALINPVSFAASLAFLNGAPSVIVQALYSVNAGVIGPPTGALADWSNTLAGLQGVTEINLIVPIHSTGGLTTSDGLSLQIEGALQTHIQFQNLNNDLRIMAIMGEDSTTGNASSTTLQQHGASLGALPYAANLVLLSPSAYTYSNPITGNTMAIGGQFVAAAMAGLLAGTAVQQTLTHNYLSGLTSVTDSRSQTALNIDAQNGLCVIQNWKNNVRIRHAITTSRVSTNTSEINVMRAMNYMLDELVDNFDSQVIGVIPLDNLAPFRIQLLATSVLESLVNSGVIVTYTGVQAQPDNDNPSAIDLVFSYLPSYPLNYINISFSINTALGIISASSSAQVTST